MTVLLFCALAAGAPTEAVSAETIMARVAANQDRAERAREAYIYRQQVIMRLRDSRGTLVREEISDYSVTPTAEGIKKQLERFSGAYKAKKGGMVSYTKSGAEAADRRVDIDAEIVSELREELVDDAHARDGLAPELFPLTTKQQARHQFRLEGEDTWRGLPVYRISFKPKAGKNRDFGTESGPWAGEVLVTRDDAQPVLITTRLAKKVPAAIRTLLGTNLEGLGFSIRYEKFDGGAWFPVSFGTEFRVRALFFYKRVIGVSLQNSGFRKTDVSSTVRYEDVR